MYKFIRKYARQVYAQHAGKLILCAAIFYFTSFFSSLLVTTFITDALPSMELDPFTPLLTLLLGPLSLGLVRMVYLAYLGERPSVGAVFYYYGGGARLLTAWGAYILMSIPSYVGLLFNGISLLFFDATLSNIFSDSNLFYYDPGAALGILLFALVLSILLLILNIYWSFHVMMMPYIMARDDKAGPLHTLKESFRLMRGNCGRYFMLLLGFWPFYLLLFFIVLIAMMIWAAIMLPSIMANPFATPNVDSVQVVTFFVYLLISFFEPYQLLALSALADSILTGKIEYINYKAKTLPSYVTWEQINWEVEQEMAGDMGGPYGRTPYGQTPYGQTPYTPQGPFVPPSPYGAPPYGQTPYGQPPLGPQTAQYPQNEEEAQRDLFLRGLPMNSRIFLLTRTVPHYSEVDFGPLLAASDVYAFLRQSDALPEQVARVWGDCVGDMDAFPQWAGHYSEKAAHAVIGGTPIRTVACIQENSEHAGYYVSLRIEVNPRK